MIRQILKNILNGQCTCIKKLQLSETCEACSFTNDFLTLRLHEQNMIECNPEKNHVAPQELVSKIY